jgi:hypothetical protein
MNFNDEELEIIFEKLKDYSITSLNLTRTNITSIDNLPKLEKLEKLYLYDT